MRASSWFSVPSVFENEEFSSFHFGPFSPYRIGQEINIVQGLWFLSFSIGSAFFSVVTCVRVWSGSAVPVGERPIPSESSSGYRSGKNQLQAAFEAQRTPVVWTKLRARLHPHQSKGAYWQKGNECTPVASLRNLRGDRGFQLPLQSNELWEGSQHWPQLHLPCERCLGLAWW